MKGLYMVSAKPNGKINGLRNRKVSKTDEKTLWGMPIVQTQLVVVSENEYKKLEGNVSKIFETFPERIKETMKKK
jgi:hypothetical protein